MRLIRDLFRCITSTHYITPYAAMEAMRIAGMHGVKGSVVRNCRFCKSEYIVHYGEKP
ncbi:MAG: hypothetical protein ACYCOU_01800 [Sulfobacillus sp.]